MKLHGRPSKPPGGDGPPVGTSVTEAEALQLHGCAGQGGGLQWLQRGRIAEIGTAFGFSAICMALGGALVVTADPHQEFDSLTAAAANLRAYEVHRQVQMRVGLSTDVFDLDIEGGSYDGAFVDGDHSYAAVLTDAALVAKLVRPGGWIAFHDYGEDGCPGVAAAIDELGYSGVLTDTLLVTTQ